MKLFILSSPHNPVGRVWTPDELRLMLEICRRHGVYVLSDEIHHDFVFGDRVHTPSALAAPCDEFLITLTAASKTFNLAGCQNSFVVIPDAGLRERYDRFTTCIRIQSGNPFGYVAAESAYRGGEPWLREVREIIWENYRTAREGLLRQLPLLYISPLEGTYLMWIDFGAYLKAEEMREFMENTCGLAFDYGDWFGGERFGTHIRMNLATSGDLVRDAVSRITQNLTHRS